MSITVTKTYLPPLDEYIHYLERIWDSGWITNNGELVLELEKKLAEYLDVPFVQYVTNGTTALQIALKALNIEGEVITTPFSYVATVNSIIWEHCKPVFVDIDESTFGIDPSKIEAAITKDTRAIMPVHVYGYPCAVDEIQSIAKKNNLKVIYDAAHAFGCKHNDISLVSYGDVSTISFHATKLFHTIEGGAIISHDAETNQKISLLKSFGHKNDDYFMVGINGKTSEFNAAMGLCILPKVREIIEKRKQIFEWYKTRLSGLGLRFPTIQKITEYNYSYHPIVFNNENQLLLTFEALKEKEIIPRRYFFPSLNKLTFVNGQYCPISEKISSRVLCLPLYDSLSEDEVEVISSIIQESII